jgi:hypothetical protein
MKHQLVDIVKHSFYEFVSYGCIHQHGQLVCIHHATIIGHDVASLSMMCLTKTSYKQARLLQSASRA